MFACMCMRFEKILKKIYEMVYYSHSTPYIYTVSFERVCVSLLSGAATQHACQKLFSKYNMYRKQRAADRHPNNVKT